MSDNDGLDQGGDRGDRVMDRRQVYCGGRITGCAETAGIRKREGLKMRNTFLPLVLDG